MGWACLPKRKVNILIETLGPKLLQRQYTLTISTATPFTYTLTKPHSHVKTQVQCEHKPTSKHTLGPIETEKLFCAAA